MIVYFICIAFASTSNWPIKMLSSETISVIWRFRSKHHKFFWCAMVWKKIWVFTLLFSSFRGHQKGEDEDSKKTRTRHSPSTWAFDWTFLFCRFSNFVFFVFIEKRDRTGRNVSRLEWPQFTSSSDGSRIVLFCASFSLPIEFFYSIEMNKNCLLAIYFFHLTRLKL